MFNLSNHSLQNLNLSVAILLSVRRSLFFNLIFCCINRKSYQIIKYFVHLVTVSGRHKMFSHTHRISPLRLVIFDISQRVRFIYVTTSIITHEARMREDVSEIGCPIISTMTTLVPNLFSKSNEQVCFMMPNTVTTAHSQSCSLVFFFTKGVNVNFRYVSFRELLFEEHF